MYKAIRIQVHEYWNMYSIGLQEQRYMHKGVYIATYSQEGESSREVSFSSEQSLEFHLALYCTSPDVTLHRIGISRILPDPVYATDAYNPEIRTE